MLLSAHNQAIPPGRYQRTPWAAIVPHTFRPNTHMLTCSLPQTTPGKAPCPRRAFLHRPSPSDTPARAAPQRRSTAVADSAAPMWNTRAVWPASVDAAAAADWPRRTEARGSPGLALVLAEVSGEPSGRVLCHLRGLRLRISLPVCLSTTSRTHSASTV